MHKSLFIVILLLCAPHLNYAGGNVSNQNKVHKQWMTLEQSSKDQSIKYDVRNGIKPKGNFKN